MDEIDRKICEVLQSDGRATSSDIASTIGVSVSTANDRVRRLVSTGVVRCFRAILDNKAAGTDFCCFLFIDMDYEGEQDAVDALGDRPEVLELHHISGPHSYLAKVRVADAAAIQAFVQNVVKPLKAVTRTETLFSMTVAKETSEVEIAPADTGR